MAKDKDRQTATGPVTWDDSINTMAINQVSQQLQMLRRSSGLRPQNDRKSRNHPKDYEESPEERPFSSEPAKYKKIFEQKKTTSKLRNPFSEIEECPTVELTVHQMKGDMLELLGQLQKDYADFGAVKLVACPEWQPPFTFRYLTAGITTRNQILQNLSQGKPFQQNIEAHSLYSYKSMARDFQKKYTHVTRTDGTPFEQNEFQFWSLVNNPKYKQSTVQVEYAADIPTSKYCSGFPISRQKASVDDYFSYHDSLFNLNNTFKDPRSLLQICESSKSKISGITQPWIYMGMKFSSFCWHVEDLYMNSINYNHKGSTKTWYVIPGSQKQKLDQYIMDNCQHLSKGKKEFVHRMTLMISPLDLKKAGITVHKINQQQKCYVVTFPKAYHCGFSQGYNIGEAVNYSILPTLPFMTQAQNSYKLLNGKKYSVFPVEWVIAHNFEQLESSKRGDTWISEIAKEYHQCVMKELSQIKSLVKMKLISKYTFLQPTKQKYFKNPCANCQHYLYLSMMRCKTCRKVYCLDHSLDCCNDQFQLVLRQLGKERLALKKCLEDVPCE